MSPRRAAFTSYAKTKSPTPCTIANTTKVRRQIVLMRLFLIIGGRIIWQTINVRNGWKADVSLCIGPFTLGLDKKAAFIGKMSVGGARPRQTGGRMEAT